MSDNCKIDVKQQKKRAYRQRSPGGGTEITIIRSAEDIENIRPIWEQMYNRALYPVPNAHIDRYLAIAQASGDDVQPYVMSMGHSDHPTAMVIGRIERHRLRLRLGYKVLLSPELKCLTVVYGGIIGQPSRDACTALIRELMNVLRRREADIVFFNHLRNDSHMLALAKSVPNVLCRQHFSLSEMHWQTPLPDTVDKFFDTLSSKQKRNLRRDIKRLEKQTSGSVRVVHYRDVADVDDMIDKVSEIFSSTYQQGLGVGFSDDDLTRSILRQSACCGWLRGYVLFAGDTPLAYEIGTVYGDVYFADDAGYDARWRSYGSGTILQLKIFEDLSADSTVNIYDFGFGHAQYKEKYGRISWPETSVYIFAPRLYLILVNQAKSLISLTSKLLAYLTTRTGMSGSLKRYWRHLLLQKEKKS